MVLTTKPALPLVETCSLVIPILAHDTEWNVAQDVVRKSKEQTTALPINFGSQDNEVSILNPLKLEETRTVLDLVNRTATTNRSTVASKKNFQDYCNGNACSNEGEYATNQNTNVGYEVKELQGRGYGLVATKPFYPGDLIMREVPIIDMPDKIFSTDDPDYIENWLDKKINRMSSENRAKFYNLSDARSSGFEEAGPGDDSKTTLGIFYTNCMSFINESAALFPTMARSNHSCTPNSEFISRPKIGVQDLVATSTIVKGDEITLSYVPAANEGSDQRNVRIEYLIEWYGFCCKCRTCCLQGHSLRLDDILRQKVKTLQCKNSDDLTLLEMEELVDGLRNIESKFVYQREILDLAISKAVDAHDMSLAAKFLVASLIVKSIIDDKGSGDENGNSKEMLYDGLGIQQPVRIGNSDFLFALSASD